MKDVSKNPLNTKILLSIFESPPLDLGGIHARQGFAYQDDVAAGFYLQMLSSVDLLEVSCETYDDILLVWQHDGNKTLEFVQVKAEHLDQLWTIAKLCEQSKSSKTSTKIGTSILEKNLFRDQYRESSWFRVVTCRQVDPDLGLLTRDRHHEHRAVSYAPFKYLADEVERRLPGVQSKKGNNLLFWLTNAYWDVIADKDIERLNMQVLTQALYELALPYDPDTVRAIYHNLRTLAKQTAEFGDDRWQEKRISRDQLLTRLKTWLDPLPDKGKVERLERKFADAGLDSVCLNVAKDQRLFYLQKKRSESYFTTEQTEEVEQQVLDKLHDLRSALDSGKIKATGAQFHDLCLNGVRALQPFATDAGASVIPSYLSGCMYEITARCRHRFTRLQP